MSQCPHVGQNGSAMQTIKLHVFGIIAAAAFIGGCSSVGPGLVNHPGDCAIGVPWADCLPGTAGYNNGGGRIHREAAKQQVDIVNDAYKAANEQCHSDMRVSTLDLIRSKVQLIRTDNAGAPPFDIATNDAFPTPEERTAIGIWAKVREGCIARTTALETIPPNATPLQVNFIQSDRSFDKEVAGQVGQLIVALYQQKLTYGEFAQRRYEASRDGMAAQIQFRQAALQVDQARQMQAQQMAQEQLRNSVATWAAFNQSVSARQPRSVHLNCASIKTGNVVNTNCN